MDVVDNRVRFMQEIELHKDISLEYCIKDYFDQMMCMYNIVEHVPLSNIKMDCDGKVVNFSLCYNNNHDADIIESRLSFNNIIEIYKSRFIVNVERIDNILNVVLTKQ